MKKPLPFQWEHDADNNNYHSCGLTGYTGMDYHTVAQLSVMPAWRAQVGKRGFYKTVAWQSCRTECLPDGDKLLVSYPVNKEDMECGIVDTVEL